MPPINAWNTVNILHLKHAYTIYGRCYEFECPSPLALGDIKVTRLFPDFYQRLLDNRICSKHGLYRFALGDSQLRQILERPYYEKKRVCSRYVQRIGLWEQSTELFSTPVAAVRIVVVCAFINIELPTLSSKTNVIIMHFKCYLSQQRDLLKIETASSLAQPSASRRAKETKTTP